MFFTKKFQNWLVCAKFLRHCCNITENNYLVTQEIIVMYRSVPPLTLQSCTLYVIFTDANGLTAGKHYWSRNDVIRKAARLAVSNIRRFGRPIPTFSQLRQITDSQLEQTTTF